MKYLNNPLNLRYSARNNWRGQIAPKRGFCQFKSVEYGLRAAMITICRSYRKRGIRSVSQLITTFAPPSENKTSVYIDYVCGAVGLKQEDDFLAGGLYSLMSAMCRIETGYRLSRDMYDLAVKIANLKEYEYKVEQKGLAGDS